MKKHTALHWYCKVCEHGVGRILKALVLVQQRQDKIEKKIGEVEKVVGHLEKGVGQVEKEVAEVSKSTNSRTWINVGKKDERND